MCVELVDMGDIVGTYISNGLGRASKRDCCTVIIIISSTLYGSVVVGLGWARVLCQTFDLHCRVEGLLHTLLGCNFFPGSHNFCLIAKFASENNNERIPSPIAQEKNDHCRRKYILSDSIQV